MLLALLTVLFGLAVSYRIVSIVYRGLPAAKFANLVFGVYLSLVVVIGFLVDYFRLPLSNSLWVFIAVGAFVFFFGLKRNAPSGIDKKDSKTFSGV